MNEQYDFIFTGGKSNSYLFDTDYGITYEVKFKSFDYLFDNDLFKYITYEFVIEIFSKSNDTEPPPSDERIPSTIAAIFYDFLDKQTETVVVYVCDSSDGRQMARHRKFSGWFSYFDRGSYIKVDFVLAENDERIPVSLLLHRKNPYKGLIIEEFERITDGYGQVGK
jgi:Family of unknown function (DUF6169)